MSSQETYENPQLIDIIDMPDFNSAVKNGLTSISEGKIFWTENNRVTCRVHGACLCLNKDRTIWRCPACNEGAYVIWDFNLAIFLRTVKAEIKAEEVDVLGMFAYQGPPSKRWIETKGEYYEGWNKALYKAKQVLANISLRKANADNVEVS